TLWRRRAPFSVDRKARAVDPGRGAKRGARARVVGARGVLRRAQGPAVHCFAVVVRSSKAGSAGARARHSTGQNFGAQAPREQAAHGPPSRKPLPNPDSPAGGPGLRTGGAGAPAPRWVAQLLRRAALWTSARERRRRTGPSTRGAAGGGRSLSPEDVPLRLPIAAFQSRALSAHPKRRFFHCAFGRCDAEADQRRFVHLRGAAARPAAHRFLRDQPRRTSVLAEDAARSARSGGARGGGGGGGEAARRRADARGRFGSGRRRNTRRAQAVPNRRTEL